jgi:hypothetical protein
MVPTPGRLAPERDQELARLFGDCGWTQERIAGRMGQSVMWVCYRLRFGRFIAFYTRCVKSESPPKSLTEGHFRKKWSEAKKAAHRKDTEADVFAKVGATTGNVGYPTFRHCPPRQLPVV